MNPNNPNNGQPPRNMPPGIPPQMQGQRELTEDALNKKFSFSFTRGEIMALRAPMIRFWNQFGLGDVRMFIQILDKLDVAFALTDSDYKKPEVPNNNPHTGTDEAAKDKVAIN